MKRRDFLAVMSAAGAGAAVGHVALGSKPAWAKQGRLSAMPRRQGAGYPVQVQLHLPRGRELIDPPALAVIREGAERWSGPFEAELYAEASGDGRWFWRWTPPVVRPTSAEMDDEVIRYRLVALDENGGPIGVVSTPVEVVCAQRGWGC